MNARFSVRKLPDGSAWKQNARMTFWEIMACPPVQVTMKIDQYRVVIPSEDLRYIFYDVDYGILLSTIFRPLRAGCPVTHDFRFHEANYHLRLRPVGRRIRVDSWYDDGNDFNPTFRGKEVPRQQMLKTFVEMWYRVLSVLSAKYPHIVKERKYRHFLSRLQELGSMGSSLDGLLPKSPGMGGDTPTNGKGDKE